MLIPDLDRDRLLVASDGRPRQPSASNADARRIFAADVNLGFPIDDPAWGQLFHRHGVQIASYDDMETLTNDLKAHVKTLSYLPAANCYYFRDDPSYEAVASALYAADRTLKLTSVLVVGKPSGIGALDQLRGRALGLRASVLHD
jgi:hypothetical protein